jgi:predicted acyl esterase
MKKIILLPFLFYFSFTAMGQANAQDSAWIRDNYTKKEVYITMRDGVKLFTAIYLPKDATEKHPILMTRTPYSCSPLWRTKFQC